MLTTYTIQKERGGSHYGHLSTESTQTHMKNEVKTNEENDIFHTIAIIYCLCVYQTPHIEVWFMGTRTHTHIQVNNSMIDRMSELNWLIMQKHAMIVNLHSTQLTHTTQHHTGWMRCIAIVKSSLNYANCVKVCIESLASKSRRANEWNGNGNKWRYPVLCVHLRKIASACVYTCSVRDHDMRSEVRGKLSHLLM